MNTDFFVKILSAVQQRHPLVHQITNYVTVTDCANATLAIGGSPVMAHSILETAEMASLSQAVLLNIGTPDETSAAAMLRAGQAANRNKIPVVLDPVGAGATPFRKELCETLLHGMQVDILRGNQAEIRALLQLSSGTRELTAWMIRRISENWLPVLRENSIASPLSPGGLTASATGKSLSA